MTRLRYEPMGEPWGMKVASFQSIQRFVAEEWQNGIKRGERPHAMGFSEHGIRRKPGVTHNCYFKDVLSRNPAPPLLIVSFRVPSSI